MIPHGAALQDEHGLRQGASLPLDPNSPRLRGKIFSFQGEKICRFAVKLAMVIYNSL